MGNKNNVIVDSKSMCTITTHEDFLKRYNVLTYVLSQEQQEKIVTFILESKSGEERIRTQHKSVMFHKFFSQNILDFSFYNDFCHPYIEHILTLTNPSITRNRTSDNNPFITRWIVEKISAGKPCLFLATNNPELTTFMIKKGADVYEKTEEDNKESDSTRYIYDNCTQEVKTLYINSGFMHPNIIKQEIKQGIKQETSQELKEMRAMIAHLHGMIKMIIPLIPDDKYVNISGEIVEPNIDQPESEVLVEVTDE